MEDSDSAESQDVQEMEKGDFEALKYEKFGQKKVIDDAQLQQRLYEVKKSFYNRLESANLIKKSGRIPFGEHMTVQGSIKDETEGVDDLEINDDLKRELKFYNQARSSAMKGMEILIQAKTLIDRPDDYLAEMLKSDAHMKNVKK